MLVISRDEGEAFTLGEEITITIIRAGRKVRIGIEAPPHVKVLRTELARRPQPKLTGAPLVRPQPV